MKFKTGRDLMRYEHCIRFRDVPHGALRIRKIVDKNSRARVEIERAVHDRVGSLVPLLAPLVDALIPCKPVALCPRRFYS